MRKLPELFPDVGLAAARVAVQRCKGEKGKNVTTIIRIWHFDKGEPTTVKWRTRTPMRNVKAISISVELFFDYFVRKNNYEYFGWAVDRTIL